MFGGSTSPALSRNAAPHPARCAKLVSEHPLNFECINPLENSPVILVAPERCLTVAALTQIEQQLVFTFLI